MVNSVSFSQKVNTIRFKSYQSVTPLQKVSDAEEKPYANNVVTFAQAFPVLEKSRLMQKYEKGGYESFADFILSLDENTNPKEVRRFLNFVCENEDTFNKFADDIFKKPEDLNKITGILTERLGGKEEFLKWYNDPKTGYKKSYSKYYKNLFNNSGANNLFKFSPNINYTYFVNRRGNFTLGKLPAGLDREDFTYLSDVLNGTVDENKLCGTGKKFMFGTNKYEFFKDPKTGSRKNIYFVKINGSKYIVKSDHRMPLNHMMLPSERYNDTVPTALFADSTYQNAAVDYYLKSNNVKNAADFIFYDSSNQTSLYKYTEGEDIEEDNTISSEEFNKKYLKGANNLGIYANDTYSANFKTDCKTGNTVMIDSGHCTYSNIMKPDMLFYNMNFANSCGRDFIKDMGTLEFVLKTDN